ncbi:32910_t:CDS:2 [Gigaspora margarita]|uniref:32910_t:CDS:1 n=1 Tax=Gigaspora margarita TaxID=4874 RepID=A0ABN7UP69_GIGMA|nr:32910_t:CDS:2 [Gigaspora margarita]
MNKIQEQHLRPMVTPTAYALQLSRKFKALKKREQNPTQQLGELLNPRDEMDVDLTLREASVDTILEEGDSKNNTENQQILYSQAVTGPREPRHKY